MICPGDVLLPQTSAPPWRSALVVGVYVGADDEVWCLLVTDEGRLVELTHAWCLTSCRRLDSWT